MNKTSALYKQADPSRNAAVADRRRVVAADRAAGRPTSIGTWNDVMEIAPLPFQVFNPQLYTANSWDHVGDVAKGTAKGTIAGANTLAQTGLSIGQNLLDNRLWSWKGGSNALGHLKDGYSDVAQDWQNALGPYKYDAKPSDGNILHSFINNPGQSAARVMHAAVPAIASTMAFNAAGQAVGAAGAKAAPFLAKLPGGAKVLNFAKAWSNAIPNAVNKYVTPRVGRVLGKILPKTMAARISPYVNSAISATAKNAPQYAAAAVGSSIPALDKATGVTYYLPSAVQPMARRLLPWLSFATPVSAALNLIYRAPAIQEGIATGVARGAVEGEAQNTSSGGGAWNDYIAPSLSYVAANGPKHIQDAYKFVADGTNINDVKSPEFWRAVQPYLTVFNKNEPEAVRAAAREEAKKRFAGLGYNRALALSGIQPTAQSAVKGLAKNIYGAVPNYAGAAIKGVNEAIRNNPFVAEGLFGKENANDARITLDSLNKLYNAKAETTRDALNNGRQIYTDFRDKISPKFKDAIDRRVSAISGTPARVLERYPGLLNVGERIRDWWNKVPVENRERIGDLLDQYKERILNTRVGRTKM